MQGVGGKVFGSYGKGGGRWGEGGRGRGLRGVGSGERGVQGVVHHGGQLHGAALSLVAGTCGPRRRHVGAMWVFFQRLSGIASTEAVFLDYY